MTTRGGLYSMGTDSQGRTVWRIRALVDGVHVDERIHGTKTEAKAKLSKLRTQAAEGTLAESDGETVTGLCAAYIEHRVSLGKVRAGQSEATYRGYVKNHVAPAIGSMLISDVRPVHAQKVVDAMMSIGRSPSGVRQTYAIAHGAFKWALEQRRIPVNPFDAVTLPTVGKPKLTISTKTQTATLLACIEDDYLVPVKLAAATGLRRGEVCAVRWDGLYLDGNHESCAMGGVPHLHVEGTMQRVGSKLTTMPPKSESGRRAVTLGTIAVAMLRRHRTEQAERRLLLGEAWSDTDLVIDRGDGSPMDPDRLTAAFRRGRTKAGIPGVRLHDLRHAWATAMIGADQNAAAVSAALGHATVGFTMSVYVHPNAEMGASLAVASDEVLGEALGKL